MARQEKLVLTIAANGKVAKTELKNLDDAIKRVADQADAAGEQMQDMQKAAKASAKEAEKAGKAQAKAAEKASAATKAQAEAQKAVTSATKAAERARVASEKKIEKAVKAAADAQVAELKRVEEAKKRAAAVQEATKGSRSKVDVEARRAAAEELKLAQAALKSKQEAAAVALAAVKKEAAERKKIAAEAIRAAKEEARIRAQAAKEAGRAQTAAARNTQRQLVAAARSIQTAQSFATRIENQNDPTAALRRLGVARDADLQKKIADIERARQAALRAENLTSQEKIRINTATDAHIARERARFESQSLSQSTQALNALGMRKKAQIQQEIADVRERERQALSSVSLSSGQRLEVERRTAAEIKRLNRELANSTATAFQQRMQAAAQSLQGLGETVRNSGMGASMFVSAPSALGMRGIIRETGGLEQKIANTKAAMPDVAENELAAIRAQAIELGRTTAFSAIQVAEAAEMLAKNGVKAADITGGALQASVMMALAGDMDTKMAADMATDLMVQFGKKAEDLMGIADQVTGLTNNSKMTANDAALAIGMGGGVAGMAGFDIADTLTMFALTAPYATSGSDAGTSVKTGILRLFSSESEKIREKIGFSAFTETPELKAAKAEGKAKVAAAEEEKKRAERDLAELRRQYRGTGKGTKEIAAAQNRVDLAKEGKKAAEEIAKAMEAKANLSNLDANGKMEAVAEIADRLQTSFKGKTDEQIYEELSKLAGQDAVRSMFALYKAGRTGVMEMRGKIEAGDAQKSADIRLDTYQGQVKLMTSAISTLQIALGDSGLMEAMTWLVHKFTEFINVIAEAPPWVHKLILILGAIGTVLGPVMLVVGQFMIFNAVLAKLGAPGVGGLALNLFKQFGKFFLSIGGWVARGILAITGLVAAFLGLPVWITGVLLAVLALFAASMWKWRDEIWEVITSAFQASFDFVHGLWDAMIESMYQGLLKLGQYIASIYKDSWLAKGVNVVVNAVSGDGEEEPQKFSRGGIVRGRGTSTSDSISAKLSDGEGIIKARAVRFFGEDRINLMNSLDPRAMVVPGASAVPVPVPAGGGGRDLHPVNLTINGGGSVSGLYGTPDAIRQLEKQQTVSAGLRPTGLPRTHK